MSKAWHQAFSTAGWVLLTSKSTVRIPWNPALLAYFRSHFRLVRQLNTSTLYRRDGAKASPQIQYGRMSGPGIISMPHPVGVL